MRPFIIIFALISVNSLYGQSKKQLTAQLEALKKENAQLKADIDTLRMPKQVALSDTLKRVSYSLGTLLAGNLKTQGGDSLDLDALSAGLKDVFKGNKLQIETNEGMPMVQAYMTSVMEAKSAKLRAANTAFLEQNKKSEGIKTTASGLQYKVITTGKGKVPVATDKVSVHYTGKLIDGTVFDSSEGKEPVTLEVNNVIPGWTEALQLMHEGDKWTIYLPSELAYGERGAGEQIPPYSTLVFDVQLVKVN
jgi:FKBP-type peptidyl-prolyl cis-trans isomerase FklB